MYITLEVWHIPLGFRVCRSQQYW